MTLGCDVSHSQTNDQVKTAAATLSFVIVKASEGLANDSPKDPQHPAHDRQVGMVRAANKDAGHYHFARHTDKAAQEVDNFLALADAQPGDNLFLDLEDMDGGWPERGKYALAWLSKVQSQTGATPWWYVNKNWHSHLLDVSPDLKKYPLWIATVGDHEGAPQGVTGWKMHQYSTAGNLDHDFLAADVSWSDFAIPGDDMPLTQADADLVAKTLTTSTDFKNAIAKFVWEGDGGAPDGTPSYQNQVIRLVKSEVASIGADGGLSEAEVGRIADAVVAKLSKVAPAGMPPTP